MKFKGKEKRKQRKKYRVAERYFSKSRRKQRSREYDENDKEITENGEKVYKEIPKNSHLIIDGGALYTKFSSLGRPLVINQSVSVLC